MFLNLGMVLVPTIWWNILSRKILSIPTVLGSVNRGVILSLKVFHLVLKPLPMLGAIYGTVCQLILTRGPIGPWVAHLRKRLEVTVESFTEDHLCCPPNIGRGPLDDVIHQI